MPAIKLHKERYYKLDECFRNTKMRWSLKNLLEAINSWLNENFLEGISKRTLQDDIKYLKEVEAAPIIMYKEGNSNYFKYEDSDFSIKEKPISNQDAENIRKAVNVLKQLRGLGIGDELADTIQKLEQKVELGSELSNSLIQFEHNKLYAGNAWLADIYNILSQEKVIKLTYKPFAADVPIFFHIHPYLLKQFNGRWYLIGWCEERAFIGVYPLDRFVDARVSSKSFIKNSKISSSLKKQHLFGVTIPTDSEPEKIILRFTPQRAAYFLTKPFATIEKTNVTADKSVEVTMTLFVNKELEAAILGFGSDVEVLSPSELRETIAISLRKAAEQYS